MRALPPIAIRAGAQIRAKCFSQLSALDLVQVANQGGDMPARAGLAFCGPLLSSRRERSMDAGVRIRSPARARLKSDNPLRDLAVTNP